jgi:hypothetical protein
MKRLAPVFYHSAFIVAILLTTHIVYRTANLSAERIYLKKQKAYFLAQIDQLLDNQQQFQPHLNRTYYSYDYVMKMQEEEHYAFYRDIHRYQRDFNALLKELVDFHNNHLGLWYHQYPVISTSILKLKREATPKKIDHLLVGIREKLEGAKDYFTQLP